MDVYADTRIRLSFGLMAPGSTSDWPLPSMSETVCIGSVSQPDCQPTRIIIFYEATPRSGIPFT
jgi:hypothetical protein